MTAFKNWYEQNKDKLSAERKARYDSDPQYREKVLERSRVFRANHPPSPPPIGFDYSFDEAAEVVGVTTWTFREWRRKNYFPEPNSHGGKFYFSENQIMVLRKLKAFFDYHGSRVRKDTKAELDGVVSLVFANW